MQTAQISTHWTCNQACTYCTIRRAEDDVSFIRTPAVLGRIDAAVQQGAREVVLTGGEPGMRRDLTELVAHARAAGASAVTLETNATLIDLPRAEALRDAGLTLARVNLNRADAQLDAMTRDPGGFERTWAGLQALLTAGIGVEVRILLLRSTLDGLTAIPAALTTLGDFRHIRCLEVVMPADGGQLTDLMDYPTAAKALEALDDASRRVGIPVRLGPLSGPPPCMFQYPSRIAHFFALSPASAHRVGFAKISACADCEVKDRCPGLDQRVVDRFGVPDLRPIATERLMRRLTVASRIEDQIERDVVEISYLKHAPGDRETAHQEHLIRVNFQCNQSCRFCFVYTHLPAAADARVEQAIRDAGAADARIVLTGGEPTLHPRLVEFVALAKSLTRHPVWLQTNATRLDDAARVEALVQAGLDAATISLHAATPALSDAITEAPGTFVKTIAGLDQLAKTRVRVTLNTVISRRNLAELQDIVRLVASRWPRFALNLSFVAPSSELVPRDQEMVPAYEDAAPALEAAWQLARESGLTVHGVDAQCGIPLCKLPRSILAQIDLPEMEGQAGGTAFTHLPACAGCALRTRCFGVRRGYLETYPEMQVEPQVELPQPRPASRAS